MKAFLKWAWRCFGIEFHFWLCIASVVDSASFGKFGGGSEGALPVIHSGERGHFWYLQKALPLENPKVYGNIAKGH